MTARRELGLAVLLCLLGSALLLVGLARDWALVPVSGDALRQARSVGVPGSELVAGVRALGLVGLAGVVAVAATGGRGRAVVGGVLLAAGGWAAVEVGRGRVDLPARALGSDVAVEAGAAGSVEATLWPLLALLGAVLVGLAGLLVALRGRQWSALSQRYDAPSGAPVPVPDDEAPADSELWADLDRGVDPTR